MVKKIMVAVREVAGFDVLLKTFKITPLHWTYTHV